MYRLLKVMRMVTLRCDLIWSDVSRVCDAVTLDTSCQVCMQLWRCPMKEGGRINMTISRPAPTLYI